MTESLNRSPKEPYTSMVDMLLRLIWIMFGPMSLCVTIIVIYTQQHAWFSNSDVFFAFMLLITIGSRWLRFVRGDRLNSLGEETNLKSLWLYSAYLFFGAIVAWALVHGLSKLISR